MNYFKKMNVYLSDLAILNTKLHNLHWNVTGIHFVAIHTFTETLYTEMFESFDAVAEHLKMSGEMPIATTKGYLEAATVKEVEPRAFTISEVVETLIEDLTLMKTLATDIRKLSDEASDPIAVSLFEGHIASYNKHLWFLKSMNA